MTPILLTLAGFGVLFVVGLVVLLVASIRRAKRTRDAASSFPPGTLRCVGWQKPVLKGTLPDGSEVWEYRWDFESCGDGDWIEITESGSPERTFVHRKTGICLAQSYDDAEPKKCTCDWSYDSHNADLCKRYRGQR